MVINSRFFKNDENFVQPAEMATPICPKKGPESRFRGLFGRFFRRRSAFIFFFVYENTKLPKLPFPKHKKTTEDAHAFSVVSDFRVLIGGPFPHVGRSVDAPYIIIKVYIRRRRGSLRRPAQRRDADGDPRQKPSRWHPSGCT